MKVKIAAAKCLKPHKNKPLKEDNHACSKIFDRD
jgi:hypothetical protein